MDFKQIEAFVSVMKQGSFSKAADAIFLSQPTVSSHIHSLEKDLGVKLIDRSGKIILPTKEGELFYEYAMAMINQRDQAQIALNHSKEARGIVTVSASTVPSQYLLPKMFVDFKKQYPQIIFRVLEEPSEQVINHVLEKNIEVGIVGYKKNNAVLDYTFLCSDKLVVVTPNLPPFDTWQGDTIPLELMLEQPFVMRDSASGTRHEIEHVFKEHNIRLQDLNLVAQMNSITGIKQAVIHGLGVSVLSYLSVERHLDYHCMRVFDLENIPMERSFYLVTRKKRPLSVANNLFCQFCQDKNNWR